MSANISLVQDNAILIRRSSSDLLVNAIRENVIVKVSPQDPHPYIRNTVLAISSIASVLAGAAYVPISLQLPPEIGPLCAASNIIAFSGLDIWAIHTLVMEFLGPKGEQEALLRGHASFGKYSNLIIVAFSGIIGLLSQIPVVLPSINYNEDRTTQILGAIALFTGGSLIPITSLYQSIIALREMRNSRGELRERLNQLRTELITTIGEHQELFSKLSPKERRDYIIKMSQEKEQEEDTYRFIQAICSPFLSEEEGIDREVRPLFSVTATLEENPWITYGTKFFGALIATSMQVGLGWYTEVKVTDLTGSEIVGGIGAGAVVLSGIYLTSRSIITTTERISRAFFHCIKGSPQSSLAEELRPKLTRVLKFLGITIDILALGATVVIWNDFFKDNLPAKIYFEITLCLAYFLFAFTSTLDVVDSIAEELIRRKGTPPEKEALAFYQSLSKLRSLIASSSLIDFSGFISKCPDTLKNQLLAKVDLSIQQLDEFVASN